MLIPKLNVVLVKMDDGQDLCTTKFCVYDTEKQEFVESKFFTNYESREECQSDIDFFNSMNVISA